MKNVIKIISTCKDVVLPIIYKNHELFALLQLFQLDEEHDQEWDSFQ
jgi:hypothetical protein